MYVFFFNVFFSSGFMFVFFWRGIRPVYGFYMSGGQNYLLPAMDMAKVGGPLSVVKVCTSMLCARMGYR